jgi:hypothetical protein
MKQVSKGLKITSRICGATLLAVLASTASGHDDDQNRIDKPLTWVDKNGKPIGRAVGFNGVQVRIDGLNLILPVGNRQVCSAPFTCDTYLDVQWGGFGGGGATIGGPVVYSKAKCEGEARLVSIAPGSARAVAVIGLTLGNQKLYIGKNSPSSQFTYLSQLFPEGTCQDTPFPFTQPAWEVAKTLDLKTLPYRPSFYLR